MKAQVQVTAKKDLFKYRKDFPILGRKVHGKDLIYFDNAATSQKPQAVIDAVSNYYKTSNANVHRGVHKLSEEATEAYEQARKKVADFIKGGDSSQIVFTRNATEAINLVAYAWGRDNIEANDEILLTQMEHHSNLVPWQILAKEKGAKLKFIPINEQGELRIKNEELKIYLTPKTKLISLTHVSNVLGTVNPVKDVINEAKNFNPEIKILVDGAQAVPHLPVSVQSLGVDFYAFTGHKMLGPTGIGVLWAKRELLEKMRPFQAGGEMILDVGWEESSYNYIPWKFEAGTPNIAGAVGLGAAVDYLSKVGMKNIREHEKDLTEYALRKLESVANLEIYGPRKLDRKTGVISFNIVKEGKVNPSLRSATVFPDGKVVIHPHDLASILDAHGIAVRSGHHCAAPLMKVLGIPAAARISFHLYNTKEEIDQLVPALEKAKQIFKIN
ncbi:MAG: cysteine desulfurase [bacterium]|nr:cysteine desulfurase [bacterium]